MVLNSDCNLTYSGESLNMLPSGPVASHFAQAVRWDFFFFFISLGDFNRKTKIIITKLWSKRLKKYR